MKKQIHIIEGIIILIIILIAGLLTIKFIYNIKHEQVDPSYIWNINFKNLIVSEGSKEGSITLDNNKIDLEVTLNEEGEFYEFTIDIQNRGTLDAKIDKIDINVDNPEDKLRYSVTYLNGTSIDIGDVLKSNTYRTIRVRIEYPHQNEKIYEALKLKLALNIEYIAIY